jgi:hypothetical protein
MNGFFLRNPLFFFLGLLLLFPVTGGQVTPVLKPRVAKPMHKHPVVTLPMRVTHDKYPPFIISAPRGTWVRLDLIQPSTKIKSLQTILLTPSQWRYQNKKGNARFAKWTRKKYHAKPKLMNDLPSFHYTFSN